jgi:hypothetical protein
MVDMVNHPPHYTAHPSGVEVIQITEGLDFCLGNAVKYTLRAEHKGNRDEDLAKAAFYLARYVDYKRRHPIRALAVEFWRYCWSVSTKKKIVELLEHEDDDMIHAVLWAAMCPTPLHVRTAQVQIFSRTHRLAYLDETTGGGDTL